MRMRVACWPAWSSGRPSGSPSRRPAAGGGPGASTRTRRPRPLPGDDVVAEPVASETRGITIDAPPEHVWPWLVQMGFGKAGWYSYDRLDQRGKSADGIVEAWQTLEVGDIVPTHPGGGFEVVEPRPGPGLVLRSDTALVTAQAEAWAEARPRAAEPVERARRGDAGRPRGVGRDPRARPRSSSRPAGPSSSSRCRRPIAPHRAVPRLVRRVRAWRRTS